MDVIPLLLERVDALTEKFDKTKAERAALDAKTSTDAAAEKAAFDSRLAGIEEQIKATNDAIAKSRRQSIPGLEDYLDPAKKGSVSFARVIKILEKPERLSDPEYGIEKDVFEHMKKTAINSGTGETGGFLIPTEMMNVLIPELREKSIARALGVTVLDNLAGEITWAKSKGGITAVHVDTENEETGAESVPTYDQIKLSPKTMAAFVPISHAMMKQSSVAIEPWVRSEIATQIGLLEDKTIFVGTGAGASERGVANHPNVTDVNFGTVAYTGANQDIVKKLLDVVKTVRTKFGMSLGRLGWAFGVNAYYHIAGASKDAQGRMLFQSLLEGSAENFSVPPNLLRHPALDSTFIDTGTTTAERLLFGPWADVMLGHWGGLALASSDQTETNFRKLRMTVRGVMDYAVGIFHPETFVRVDDIDTTDAT
jgi:HK97 family phage major capsid protein